MADKNTPLEQPSEKPDLKKQAIEQVKSSLEALKAEVDKKQNPESAVSMLAEALRKAKEAHGEGQSEAWQRLSQSLQGELDAAEKNDTAKLVVSLIDDPKEKELRTDLKHLSDEIDATNEYLTYAPPLEDRLWNKTDELVAKKLESSPMGKKLKEWGINAETIRNWIISFFAGLLEGLPIPKMKEAAGKLRFRVAMDEAKRDKRLAKTDEKDLLEKKTADGTLETEWTVLYENWLTQKTAGGPTFNTPPPSIYDVLHPKEVPAAPPPPSDVFGIPKMKADGSVLNVPMAASEALTVKGADNNDIAKVSATRIMVLPENKKFDVLFNDKKPDGMTLSTMDATDPLKMEVVLRFATENKPMKFSTLVEAAKAIKTEDDKATEIEGTGLFLKPVKTA